MCVRARAERNSESAVNADQLGHPPGKGSSHDSPIAFRQRHASIRWPRALLVLACGNCPRAGIVGRDLSRRFQDRLYAYVGREGQRVAAKNICGCALMSNRRLKRDQDVSVTKLSYGTIETPDGQVLRLDTRTLIGEDTQTSGLTAT